MTTRKHFVAATALAATLVAGAVTTAIAGPRGFGFGPDFGPDFGARVGRGFDAPGFDGPGPLFRIAIRLERLADELAITDEQRAAIRAEIETAFELGRPIVEELADGHRAMRELVQAEAYDAAAAQALADQQGNLTSELILLNAQTRVNVRNILTAEQLATLEELRPRGPGG